MAERIINFEDPKEKARVVNAVRLMEGTWRFEMCRYRPRRSDRQNRYYWPCFVHEFGEYERAQGNAVTDDDVHTLFKLKFLRRSITDKNTGEQIEYIASTSKLDTAGFNAYLDMIAAWLAEFGIVVPDPSEYRERDTTPIPATKGGADAF